MMASDNYDEEKLLSSSTPPEMNPDFLVIRVVGRIVLSVIKQCWAASSAMFITICIFYWIFGGMYAFLLLCFSTAGKSSCFLFWKWVTMNFYSQVLFIMPVTRCSTIQTILPIPGYLYHPQMPSPSLLKTSTSRA